MLEIDDVLTFEEIALGKGTVVDLGGGTRFRARAQRLKLKDGTSLSVQVGRGLYCTPRNDAGPYTEVEVGYPSIKPPDSWSRYCEDPARPTETVYSYVPVDLVRKFVLDHGGEVA